MSRIATVLLSQKKKKEKMMNEKSHRLEKRKEKTEKVLLFETKTQTRIREKEEQ